MKSLTESILGASPPSGITRQDPEQFTQLAGATVEHGSATAGPVRACGASRMVWK